MRLEKDSTIRLMVVDDSGEGAEAVVNTLRNGGVPVRPFRPADAAEMHHMLASQPIDLVLAAEDARGIALAMVMEQVAASGKDIPVILLLETVTEASLAEATIVGARAVALRARPGHLIATLQAEWSDLESRRALRRLEAQLHETERRCDALIASSRDPIAYIHEGMHIRANEAYLEMFGFDGFDEIEGLSLLDMIAPQYVDDFKDLLKRLGKGELPPPRFELEARGADGIDFPAVLEFATASYEGESCVQVVFRRRELDPELAREVEDLRQRDPTTGLLNRPTFMHLLEDAVAKAARSDRRYGFLLVQADHFQKLLPEIGLDAADPLIAALAARLAECVDPDARVARYGEHSFAVLLQGDHARTAKVGETVRNAFASHVVPIDERSVSVTVSIGGVQVGEKIASLGQVLARATECLQATHDLGGNAVHIFDPSAVDRAEEERVQHWLARIHEALTGEGFSLYFQPVVNLQGESGDFYEAYLRMEVAGEVISPTAFLGIAEEHDLLARIDHWVVKRSIELLGERERSGRPTRLLVKITPASFADNRLAEMVERQLAAHGVPGERLWLKSPEAKVFTHLRNAQRFLAAMERLGCKLGLEQFGTGLDSFQLLAHFQPAFLKLDRSFTCEFSKATENLEKIRGISERAQAARIATIAEFVQDAATMSLLYTTGVHYVEGHFVGAAGPAMNYDFS